MKKGFTLIELMVVIAIIAILSGILLANFGAAKSKSRDGQRISDIAQIQLALAGYFNECNDYPPPSSGGSYLDSSVLTHTDSNCPTGITLGSFISKIPTPPIGASQTNYTYVVSNSSGIPNDFVLEATLENNSNSTESLTTLPSGISGVTCDTGVDYCIGSK